MLPRNQRLTRSGDFRFVYQRGKGRTGRFLRLRWVVRPQTHEIRVGIVVPNMVSKRATVRNRIRRQIRAQLVTLVARLKPGTDLVITATPAAIGQTSEEIAQELAKLLP